MNEYDFSGKTVIVTGSGGGIGRRIGERFFDAGANTVFADLKDDNREELLAEVAKGDDSRFLFCQVDVSDSASLDKLFEDAIARFGGVDVLVNNAGIWAHGDVFEVEESQWDKVLSIDLKAVFFASQRFAKHCREAGKPGAIVNISSINAIRPRTDCAVYNVAKAGVKSITETFALEAGKYGIRANAVGPGSVPTNLNAAVYAQPGVEEAYNATVPLGRRASKDDIANAVLFLASDDSAYLTGQTIYAEGGWLLH